MITVTMPFKLPKKFPKKLFSVSDVVSASPFRNISSICRITGPTRSGSSMRDQIIPVESSGVPTAAKA